MSPPPTLSHEHNAARYHSDMVSPILLLSDIFLKSGDQAFRHLKFNLIVSSSVISAMLKTRATGNVINYNFVEQLQIKESSLEGNWKEAF